MSHCKKAVISVVLLFLVVFNINAQTKDTEKAEEQDPIYKFVEDVPIFPGGMAAFQRYLAINLIIPEEVKAAINQEYARNTFLFLIERDGSLSKVEVIQSVQEDYDILIKEVMLKSPKWLAARQNGSAVRYQFMIPITMNVDKLKSSN